jgi:primosomal protein N' (replication factor Y) (superfamily II helicase)
MTEASHLHPLVATVRVVPDLTGLDKQFDYSVPEQLGASIDVGAVVRVPLHGRRVRGWVTDVDPELEVDPSKLQPVAQFSSRGPAAELIDVARWASQRWAAGRLRPFLVAASPPTNVTTVPAPARGRADVPATVVGRRAVDLLAAGGGVLLLPPATSPVDAVVTAALHAPALVVMPTVVRAEAMAAALARRGLRVAVAPRQWALAAAGVDVVIGARGAAWAPCPQLGVAVVIDEHDETLQEERNPTWHARDVVVERARRAGAPVLLTSPCPTATGVAAVGGPLVRLAVDEERAGWPIVNVVDRSDEEPWRTSLLSSALIQQLRLDGRLICVHNTTGRARILACRTCRALLRCTRCDAAVRLGDDRRLECPRCGTDRPAVCQACGGSGFANLRPGVTRLREELEAAAGRPVVAVTGSDTAAPDAAGIYVGTEAVLHRVDRADVVAFLDFDRELLAPRYRAGEQAMALLTKAARLLGPRQRGGRLMIQTFMPHHEVIQAAVLADPARLLDSERQRRDLLGLPPAKALARVSGPGSDVFADELRGILGLSVGGAANDYLVTAPTWDQLGQALLAAERPKGSRVRIAVDPPRV